MAEDRQDAEKNSPGHEDTESNTIRSLPFIPPLSDPSIPTVFSNNAHLAVNKSDISLTFTHEFESSEGRIERPLVRIVYTHSGFVDLVNFLQTRSAFLQATYNGFPPSLDDVDSVRMEEALRAMLGVNETETGEAQ